MAAPNIVNVTTIFGKTTYNTPSGTTAVSLLSNAAASGKVLKVNQIVVANNTSSAIAATVALNSNASGSGTSYPVATAISVPGNASLIVVDKTTAIYLEEDRSILVTSGSASNLTFSASYEEIN